MSNSANLRLWFTLYAQQMIGRILAKVITLDWHDSWSAMTVDRYRAHVALNTAARTVLAVQAQAAVAGLPHVRSASARSS